MSSNTGERDNTRNGHECVTDRNTGGGLIQLLRSGQHSLTQKLQAKEISGKKEKRLQFLTEGGGRYITLDTKIQIGACFT